MHTLPRPAVHGDLKPDNVLLTPDWQVVLTDFGLAARMPVGITGGAIAYQARETLSGRAGGPEADVFSAAVMWYELLTGRHPFGGVPTGTPDLVESHRQSRTWEMRPPQHARDLQRIVPVEEHNAEWRQHPRLDALLRRCLAPEPEARPATARILLDQIEDCLGGTCAGTSREPERAPSRIAISVAAAPVKRLPDVEALAALGRIDEALAKLDQLLGAAPHDVSAWLLKARLLTEAGRLPAARSACESAGRVAPENPGVLQALAAVFDAEGQPAAALALRRRAAALNQNAASRRR
jgi:serine/threonine-protein kinase